MVELKNYGQPLVVIQSGHLSKYWPYEMLLNTDDRTTADVGQLWAYRQKSQHEIKLIVLFIAPWCFCDNENWTSTSMRMFSRHVIVECGSKVRRVIYSFKLYNI